MNLETISGVASPRTQKSEDKEPSWDFVPFVVLGFRCTIFVAPPAGLRYPKAALAIPRPNFLTRFSFFECMVYATYWGPKEGHTSNGVFFLDPGELWQVE